MAPRRPPREATRRDPSRPENTARAAHAPRAGGANLYFNWREPFVLPIVLIVLSRAVFAYFLPQVAEDAYITLRYARSLAQGHGLVFNPGQHVMGFTSPLWTVWLSLGFLLHIDPIIWARLSSLTTDAVTLVVIARLLRESYSRVSAWCFAMFFALWPYFSAMTASAMESGLMFMLIAVSALLISRKHAAASVALAALAISRPEGFLVAAVLALRAPRRHALLAAGFTALALLPFALYFGTLIPQSVFAKSHVYGTPGPWAGRVWWYWMLPRPFVKEARVVEQGHLVAFSVLLTPAIFLGARQLWKDRRSTIAQVVFGSLLVWAGYSLLGVAYFYWYLMVPLLGFSILVAIGAPLMLRGAAVYASITVFLAGVFVDGLPVYVARSTVEVEGFGGVSDYMVDHAKPGDKALLEPIGMVGYVCPLTIVDEVGLVSPQVAKRRMQGPGWYTDIVNTERPDWLITRAGTLSTGTAWAGAGAPFRGPSEQRDLLAAYDVVDTVVAARGPQALLILHRR
jgi:hypothetical protein